MKKHTILIFVFSCTLLINFPTHSQPSYLNPPEGSSKADLQHAFQSSLYLQTLNRSIYQFVRPSVVKVVVVTKNKSQGKQMSTNPFFGKFYEPGNSDAERMVRSAGTGFVLDASGIIVTNSHVVRNSRDVMIHLANGKKIKGKVKGMDTLTDVAVIKIPPIKDLQAIPVGDSDKVRVGDIALAVGNPYELDGTFTTGIISGVRRANLDATGMKFIQTDASINQGNSGGPLLNIKGEVIGINRMIFSPSGGSIGLGFAIPIKDVQPVIASIIKNGRYDRPFLGVEIGELPAKYKQALGRSGVFVGGVFRKSGAYSAGIKPHDIILEIDNKKMTHPKELASYIKTRNVGDTVSITLMRKNKMIRVNAKIRQLNVLPR